MTYTIKRVFINIDVEDYIAALAEFPGQIDVSVCTREPNAVYDVDTFGELEMAENAVSRTAVISVEGDAVVISYEYIDGAEQSYIESVQFGGEVYACDGDFYAPACYEAVKAYLESKD